MNGIKSRIKSVSSTMQITKAMELVATSKLRRAREHAEMSRPFYEIALKAIDDIESAQEIKNSVWSRESTGENTLYVVIAGDRGLAGGYNSNIFRLTAALSSNQNASFLPVGKKALDYYTHRNMPMYSSLPYVRDVSVGDSLALAESICRHFEDGKLDKVVLVYTKFASMISQIPTTVQLLPLDKKSDQNDKVADPIYAGDVEEILRNIVPQYVGGMINSAICESLASESAARRTAMKAANKHASEMIDSLMLKYNRARQAVITQEITEIVSGSEAL